MKHFILRHHQEERWFIFFLTGFQSVKDHLKLKDKGKGFQYFKVLKCFLLACRHPYVPRAWHKMGKRRDCKALPRKGNEVRRFCWARCIREGERLMLLNKPMCDHGTAMKVWGSVVGRRLCNLVIKTGNRKVRALTSTPDLIRGLEQITSPWSTSVSTLPHGREGLTPHGFRC